jgi:hypothetical protein
VFVGALQAAAASHFINVTESGFKINFRDDDLLGFILA